MRNLMAVSALSAVLALFVSIPESVSGSLDPSDFESHETLMIWDEDSMSHMSAGEDQLAIMDVRALASEFSDQPVDMANARILASEFTEPYRDLRAARLLASEFSDDLFEIRAARTWASEFDYETDYKAAARALASEFADKPVYIPSVRAVASEVTRPMTYDFRVRFAGWEPIAQSSVFYHAY